jgi:hypothetical protein
MMNSARKMREFPWALISALMQTIPWALMDVFLARVEGVKLQ